MATSNTEKANGEGCCPRRATPGHASDVARGRRRQIGPWGTATRAVTGVAAIASGVVVPHENPLLDLPGAASDLLGVLVGTVLAPAVLTLAIWVRGRNAPRLHLGHGAASAVTVLAIGALQFYPVVVWVGVGAPLVLLAVVGRSGCELLAVPNLVLRRDDYLFCLPFSPIDTWESRRRSKSPDPWSDDRSVSPEPPTDANRPPGDLASRRHPHTS